jgi:uncharacterized protein with FMN-binding domain
MHKRAIFALLAGTAVLLPTGVSLAASPAGTKTVATAAAAAATTHTKTALKKATATTHTYAGPSVNMQWGPVQVTILVKGTTVVGLSATAPTERARSAFINSQAIPMLRQEVLQAKTAVKIKNIYGISGATMTSEAFYQSLLAALQEAKLA